MSDSWEERTRELKKKDGNHKYYLARKEYNTWLVNEYLANGCANCGEMDPIILEFHHKDPATKVRSIKSGLGRSTMLLERELDKCIVLCSTCHTRIHYNEYNAC